jgi:LmbE family N-acetylglucosaminyl deacetylase
LPVLIVAAHPDDEALGCGATASLLSARGERVHVCFLSGTVEARRNRPKLEQLHADTRAAAAILGLQDPIFGPFENIKFNLVPTLDMVQFIEKIIADTGADTIFTHYPADLNNDHLHVSHSCQAAARLFQRHAGVARLKALYLMEVLSSTEWAFPLDGASFQPNAFVEIGEAALEKKIEALRAYRGVMRDFPHPRSEEVVRGLAAYRGGQAGMKYAEAFQCVFQAL